MVIPAVARRVFMVLGVAVIAIVAAAVGDTQTATAPAAGDLSEIAPGLVVTLPGRDVGADGAPVGPGPGDGDLPSGAPPVPPGGRRGAVNVPNVVLAFRAAAAQVEGGDVLFVYRAAVAARDTGEYALAATLFDRAALIDEPLAPFAEFRAAQMSSLAGDIEGAGDRYTGLLAEGGAAESLPASIRVLALMDAAAVFEDTGRTPDAIAALSRVRLTTSNTFTLSQSYWEQARLLRDAGDPTWVDRAVEAMTVQPGASGAWQALDLLDEEGKPYPGLTAAYVEYRAFRNEAAETRYRALIDSNTLSASEASSAWFYLGAIMERYYQREDALEAYANAASLAPSGALADDARYWRGRVFEELGRAGEAATEYDLLLRDFPASAFAEDGRLRAAVALGLAGEGAIATARLAEIAGSASPGTAAEAARWHEVLVSRFDAPSAGDLSPATLDPTSYAAAFEQSGDAVTGALPASAVAERPSVIAEDRVAVDAWLTLLFGVRPVTAHPVLDDAGVVLAWRLAGAGEAAVARGLLSEAYFARRSQPWELLDLAFEARRRGLHDVALNATSLVLGRLTPQEELATPRSVLALAYPVAYLDEATAAATEFGVPVLLLLALVRQESAFNPEAGSSAGAFGLTQVIYPTGEAIARNLGVVPWSFADLARPRDAMRFGAYYLAVQLKAFDGHMLAALSAYNGGPGNASRWLEAQPFGGPDGYVYAVDFTETRAYLELVTANYAMYRYVYGLAETPRLPH